MAIWKGNDSIGDIYTHVSLNNDYGRNDTFDRSWENMLYLTCRDWALNLLFFRFSIVPKVWFWWLHGEKKVRSWWKGFLWKGEHSGNPSEVYLDLPKCVKCCACSPKNKTYQKAAFFCFYISRRSYGIFWVDQLEVWKSQLTFFCGTPNYPVHQSWEKEVNLAVLFQFTQVKTTHTMDFCWKIARRNHLNL